MHSHWARRFGRGRVFLDEAWLLHGSHGSAFFIERFSIQSGMALGGGRWVPSRPAIRLFHCIVRCEGGGRPWLKRQGALHVSLHPFIVLLSNILSSWLCHMFRHLGAGIDTTEISDVNVRWA